MKKANTVVCDYIVNKKYFKLLYSIDDDFEDYIKITFPFVIDKFDKTFHDYLGTSLAVLLASMTLTKNISTKFNFKQKTNFLKILEVLYNVRCYSEEINFIDTPVIISDIDTQNIINFKTKKQNTILFWSGGIDSTYSQLLLKQNKYKVHSIHSNINIDQNNTELEAVKYLSKKMNIDTELLSIDFPALKKIGNIYYTKFNQFPSFNSIPFGRDIIHIFAGLYYCQRYEAKYLCFGHEYELWRNYIYVNEHLVCRNDLQSEYASLEINKILKTINKELHLFSPIASLSKLYIYKSLFEYDKQILNKTTSCYFGDDCGQCNNCLLDSVLENILNGNEGSFIEFKRVVMDSKNTSPKETFAKVYYLYFYKIIQDNKNTKYFKDTIQIKFGDLLDKNKSQIIKELLSIKKVKLIPRNFKYNIKS